MAIDTMAAAVGEDEAAPAYISPRSANSLLSFSRPTRIQAVTLDAVNKILDELLYLILASAKSLATDRIKSDGILRVLGGQSGAGSGAGAVLAKNAVLEAELELRNYMDGQRKEGGKVPLGLSATSRWDGTETFPVLKAYRALRVRCQYYSTLGDLEDPYPFGPQEQNIMSSDGRPIATITPGVAIYVTALLEYVAECMLQNVSRIMERDNSDEATLDDLIKAMEEDESTSFWWNKMEAKRIIHKLRSSGGSEAYRGKVQKPWQVPDEDELDQPAGRRNFNRKSLASGSSSTTLTNGVSTLPRRSSRGQVPLSQDRVSSRGNPGTPDEHTATSSNGRLTPSSSSFATQSAASPSTVSGPVEGGGGMLRRRSSTERGWFLRRRSSFRSSQDLTAATSSSQPSTNGSNVLASRETNMQSPVDISVDGDDFESLIMSGQTMKVSLTPNRLRSMDTSTDGMENTESIIKATRRRRGTVTVDPRRQNSLATAGLSKDDGSGDTVRSNGESATAPAVPHVRPPVQRVPVKGAPPSAYRNVEAEAVPRNAKSTINPPPPTPTEEDGMTSAHDSYEPLRSISEVHDNADVRELAREASDYLDTATPPSPMTVASFSVASNNGRESRMSLVSQLSTDTSKRNTLSGAGSKVMGLFGRKSPNRPLRTGYEASNAHLASMTRSHSSSSVRSPLSATHRDEQGSPSTLRSQPLQPSDREGSDMRTPVLIEDVAEEYETQTHVQDDVGRNDALTESAERNTFDTALPGARRASMYDAFYQQPHANNSASSLPAREVPGTPTPRKVPTLNYNRRRHSGPMVASIQRIGSGSSGHGKAASELGAAPPSAWSSNYHVGADGAATPMTNGGSSHGRHVGTPGLLPSATFGRTSPSLRPNGGPATKTDTARLLVQLNQKMRECKSVDECQRLVTQALAIVAAAVHSDDANMTTSYSPPPVPGKEAGRRGNDALPVSKRPKPEVGQLPVLRPVQYRNVCLPMAVGYDPTEDDGLPLFQSQGVVAAWLLDHADDVDFPVAGQQETAIAKTSSARIVVTRSTEQSRPASASSMGGVESDFVSADERLRQASWNGHSQQSSFGSGGGGIGNVEDKQAERRVSSTVAQMESALLSAKVPATAPKRKVVTYEGAPSPVSINGSAERTPMQSKIPLGVQP